LISLCENERKKMKKIQRFQNNFKSFVKAKREERKRKNAN